MMMMIIIMVKYMVIAIMVMTITCVDHSDVNYDLMMCDYLEIYLAASTLAAATSVSISGTDCSKIFRSVACCCNGRVDSCKQIT